MNAPHTPSLFSAVELAPRDPILGVTEAFNADPNPQQGQSRRRRVLRRQRQAAAARMREARRARNGRQGCATRLPADRRHCGLRRRRQGAALRRRQRNRDVRPRGDRAGAGRHRRTQDRRRFPAQIRARRRCLHQRPELGEPSRAVRRRRIRGPRVRVLRRGDACASVRGNAGGAAADSARVDHRAACLLPQSHRRRSRRMRNGAKSSTSCARAACCRFSTWLTRASPTASSRTAASCAGLRPRRGRCSCRAHSRSRSRSTASASAR